MTEQHPNDHKSQASVYRDQITKAVVFWRASMVQILSNTFKSENFREWLKILFLFIAGIFAYYQFYYKTEVVPRRQPAHVIVKGLTKKIGVQQLLYAVESKISAINKSKTKVVVVAGWYKIEGIKFEPHCASSDEFVTFVREKKQYDRLRRFSLWMDPEVIETGRVYRNTWLYPDEDIPISVLFHIPQRYDVARFTVILRVAKQTDGFRVEWNVGDNGELVPVIIDSESGTAMSKEDMRKHSIVDQRHISEIMLSEDDSDMNSGNLLTNCP